MVTGLCDLPVVLSHDWLDDLTDDLGVGLATMLLPSTWLATIACRLPRSADRGNQVPTPALNAHLGRA